MTESENVALVRAIIESFGVGDLDFPFAHYDPGIVWENFEQECYFDADDEVVVFQRMSARGRTSGVDLDFGDYAQAWTIRDGKVVRMKFYADRSEALRAGGLDG